MNFLVGLRDRVKWKRVKNERNGNNQRIHNNVCFLREKENRPLNKKTTQETRMLNVMYKFALYIIKYGVKKREVHNRNQPKC